MPVRLLFVHGTGVRAKGYTETLETITAQVAAHVSRPITVRGCFWGEAEGARLRAGGASIPAYDETGGAPPAEADELAALWSVLAGDPWYELRLLRHRPVVGGTPFGQEPPSTRLRRVVDDYAPSVEVRSSVVAIRLDSFLDHALDQLRAAPELDEALATAEGDALEHRQVVARAIVAATLAAAETAGWPVLHGAARDELAKRVTSELHGYGLGFGAFVVRPVTKSVLRYANRRLSRDRGALSDAAAPMAGDVLRFLAHGDGARTYLRRAILDAGPGPTYLLAHSLGGIICADLLVREAVPAVAGLVTVGSQTPFLYEIGAFPALSHPDPLPDHVPPWLNVYDRRDALSYLAGGVFGDRVRDIRVDNGELFPRSHSAYWTNPQLWSAIQAFVA